MKLTKLFSALFGVLFGLLLIATAVLGVSSRNAAPVLLGTAEQADARTEALMEAVCQQDYASAEALLVGNPSLTPERETANALSRVLWEAYGDSLSYAFTGSCHASGDGLSRYVTVTMLDIPAVLETLQAQSSRLLTSKAAADLEAAYDESGTYREEFVMEVLAEAAQQLLEAEAPLTSRELTLQLVCRNGQWLIQPDSALTDVLSGGMGGI